MPKPATTNARPAGVRRQKRQELKLRRILVPLDFSGLSRQALQWAVPLARQEKARISFVHVLQSPVVMQSLPDGSMTFPVNVQGMVSSAQERLDQLAAQLLPAAVRGTMLVQDGNAALGVVGAAKKIDADLIVLAATGRSGLKRVMLGSTAERIVRHAHCPVLAVRRRGEPGPLRQVSDERPEYPKQLPWRRILVPLDFSLTSLRALNVAVPLAKQSRAQLLLLHVVEPNPYPAGLEGAVLAMPDAELTQQAKTQLPRVARHFVPKSVRVTTLVRHGRAASVVVETAEERKVDLIVLSSHGHSALERLLMGSTAEHIVRHASCPVWIARKT